jgi:hypothetical protein
MLDFDTLARAVVTLIIASSFLLLAVGITWRLALKPTMQAFLDYRTMRGGADPALSRRMAELEDEVRALKERVGLLPDGNPSRRLGTEVPLRGTKEKA